MIKRLVAIVLAATPFWSFVLQTASAETNSTDGAAREEAARAELRPICADKAVRDRIIAEIIEQGADYEQATAKWDLDSDCGQVNLPVAAMHETADMSDEASHSDWIYDIRWSPDGRLIATAGRDGSVRLWDFATGKVVRKIDITKLPPRMTSSGADKTPVREARFIGDGRSIVVAADTHPVRVFDVGSGEPTAEVPYSVPDPKWEIAPFISTTASGLAIVGGYGGEVIVYDVNAKAERYRLPGVPNDYPHFAASDASGLLVTTRPGNERAVIIELRDLATGKPLWTAEAKGSSSAASLAFSHDGKQLVVAVDGVAHVYSVAERKLVNAVVYYPAFGGGLDIAFTADGKRLITGSRHAQLWDIATGARVHHFGPFRDLLHAVDVSPDGKFVATGHMGSDGRIWEIDTGKFFRRLGKNVYPPG